mmetsp:Transcript_7803/g.22156  ORF Transcript_7803/g.22156 Transcript_7803/m.22156 type:complete len:232 (-) Transcript_7803:952-1647(-)
MQAAITPAVRGTPTTQLATKSRQGTRAVSIRRTCSHAASSTSVRRSWSRRQKWARTRGAPRTASVGQLAKKARRISCSRGGSIAPPGGGSAAQPPAHTRTARTRATASGETGRISARSQRSRRVSTAPGENTAAGSVSRTQACSARDGRSAQPAGSGPPACWSTAIPHSGSTRIAAAWTMARQERVRAAAARAARMIKSALALRSGLFPWLAIKAQSSTAWMRAGRCVPSA